MSDKTLSTKLAGWTDPALATRIRQYRKEGKNARPYVAELNRRLRALAHTAIGSCVAADVKELAETPDASNWRSGRDRSARTVAGAVMYNVTSLFDHKIKFTGLLFQCQRWIAEHGSHWHMHTVSPL